MDLNPYIKELREEHARVDETIKALESMLAREAANGTPVKRGRGRPRKIRPSKLAPK